MDFKARVIISLLLGGTGLFLLSLLVCILYCTQKKSFRTFKKIVAQSDEEDYDIIPEEVNLPYYSFIEGHDFEEANPQPSSEHSFSTNSRPPHIQRQTSVASDPPKLPALYRQKSTNYVGLGWIDFSVSYDKDNEFLNVCLNRLLNLPERKNWQSDHKILVILRVLPGCDEIRSSFKKNLRSPVFLESHMIKLTHQDLKNNVNKLLFSVFAVDKKDIYHPIGHTKLQSAAFCTTDLDTCYHMQLLPFQELEQLKIETSLNIGLEYDVNSRVIRIGLIALCNITQDVAILFKDTIGIYFILQTYHDHILVQEQRSELCEWNKQMNSQMDFDLFVSHYFSVNLIRKFMDQTHFVIQLVCCDRLSGFTTGAGANYAIESINLSPPLSASLDSVNTNDRLREKSRTRDIIRGCVHLGPHSYVRDRQMQSHWNEMLSSPFQMTQKLHPLKPPESRTF